ncbi:MAG TPA: glycerol-3-phosphate 1-O-acyltransferase PlsY [Bryobacteraceae bacterium]|nr:glycerol-3-phosphate 1-O-acyltransferase PlsY [Bryobacteraceae bacterium]
MKEIASLAIAYLLGAIPFGYLLVKIGAGKDVRASGSRNIGATNVLRTTNRGLGVATLLLDIGKGFLAVWIAARLTNDSAMWTSAAALAAIAGHSYPVFLGFKGGKAVATFIGAFLYIAPIPLLASLLVFIVVVAGTGYISAGSIIAVGAFPLGVWLISHPGHEVLLHSVIASAFIVWRHKSNLQRLRAGTEYPFRWRDAE